MKSVSPRGGYADGVPSPPGSAWGRGDSKTGKTGKHNIYLIIETIAFSSRRKRENGD